MLITTFHACTVEILGNRGEYKSQSWDESTNMTDLTQEYVGYLQSINSLCVELEKMPLITFWSKFLEDLWGRVRPFRVKKFFAHKRNKTKLDLFHMCFACSLLNVTSIFSLLFASNFLLRFTLVIFTSKQNKAKQNSSLFFHFFCFFSL